MCMHIVAKYQQMADEGLVQFLVLAKGAKGAACSALIQQVLNNKKIFVFGELLAMPNVQAVSVWLFPFRQYRRDHKCHLHQ